jgi:hypothetical protein
MPFTEYLADETRDSLFLTNSGLLKPQTTNKHRLADFPGSPIGELKDTL